MWFDNIPYGWLDYILYGTVGIGIALIWLAAIVRASKPRQVK